MNDPAVITIISKSILCVLLVLGGILSIVYGYRVFRHHTDATRSRMVLNMTGVKITAEGAGVVIAAQAIAWAWLGVHVSPNYEASREQTKVFSFATPIGNVQAPVLKAVPLNTVTTTDLKAAFAKALRTEQKTAYKIAGAPAVIDYASISQIFRDGTTYYKADLKSSDGTAEVQYRPIKLEKNGQWSSAAIVFEPSLATVKGWKTP